jgi:hypothetical protein
VLPLLALLAGLLLGWLVAINTHGRRLSKHDAWLARLDIVLGNLHAERQRNYVQHLQRQTTRTQRPVPPGTIEVRDEDLIIEKKEPPP